MYACTCRCDSIEKLRKRTETLEKEIQDPKRFKDFYQFTFNFAKNPGQKGLGKIIVLVCRLYVLNNSKYKIKDHKYINLFVTVKEN